MENKKQSSKEKTGRYALISSDRVEIIREDYTNLPKKDPPLTPIPRLIKRGYDLVFTRSQNEDGSMSKKSIPPGDPVEIYRKTMQWRWWILGIMGSLIALGFYTSQHLGLYSRKIDVNRAQSEHSKIHTKIDTRIETIDARMTDIRLEQVRQGERSKLIDTRLELLLEVQTRETKKINPHQRRLSETEAARLRREIERHQRRLDRLESDPRVKKTTDDPLEGLDL